MPIAALFCAFLAPVVLYASPRGNDTWAGSASRPFQTLDRLQEEVSRLRTAGDLRPILAKLSGRFVLNHPWEIGAEFGEVTIDGQNKTVLDGGAPLGEWSSTRVNGREAWECPVPAGYYRQLFVHGERRPRAALPKEDFYRLVLTKDAASGEWNVGQDEASFRGTDIRPYADLAGAELVANHYWVQSRMRVRSVDESAHRALFDRKSVFRLTDDYTGAGAPYRLENLLDALTEPGEWYFDVSRTRILYLPKPGERKNVLDAWAGRIPALLVAKRVRRLTLRGLAFEHAEWQPPADSAGDPQAAVSTPAAVQFVDARNCVMSHCEVRHCGTYAVQIDGQSTANAIEACEFRDLGGGGVKIGHGTDHTTVADCIIEQCGRIFASAVGVWIGDSGANHVAHNRIRDLYYTGISVGWVWGYGPSRGAGNVIEYNDISDVGQGRLSDMGGVYTLGVSPGTVIAHNRIRNVDARGYGGWGIYLDEGSTGIVVSDNLVENTKTGSFHQHYGEENSITNNVFLNARTAGQLVRTRREDHRSFSMRQNVVSWADTDLLAGDWQGDGFAIDRNVYWRTDGKPVEFVGRMFADWQAMGHDGESLVADPQMIVSEKGVRFRKDSPAKKLGIADIDLSTVGPRR